MNSNIQNSMGSRDWLLLLSLATLWGGSFFIIAIAIKEVPPLTLVALRVGLAAIALWVFALLSGERFPVRAELWLAFFIMGLLNNVIPFSLIFWGQKTIPGGLAAILNAATPLFTVIVASVFLRDEKLTPLKAIGTLLGIIGVGVMIGPDAFALADGEGSLAGTMTILAQLAVLGAALSYAFAGTFGRRFKGMGLSTTVIAAGQVTASTLIMIPVVWIVEKPAIVAEALSNTSSGTWVSIVILALFCTALAYLLYFKILASAGATNLSLVTLLIPVVAVILGWIYLNEQLGWLHLAGMLLIAAGLSAIDGRLWKKFKSR